MKREKLDSVDAELIRETIEGGGYRKIRARLAAELERKITSLVQPQPELETAATRGFIAGLRTALQIPDILIAEGKAKPVADRNERVV